MIYGDGVSRSGAICLAYLMNRGMFLLAATKLLKDARRTALCNTSFMRQLIRYAQEQALIDPEPSKVGYMLCPCADIHWAVRYVS